MLTRPLPSLALGRHPTSDAYLLHRAASIAEITSHRKFERDLKDGRQEFAVPGWCVVCRRPSQFHVDHNYAYEVDGELMPNWRERMSCPRCNLNNRMRAAVHILSQECNPGRSSRIYISEQVTPLYWALRARYRGLVGSEYLGDAIPFGTVNNAGVRNESVTRLTFPDDSFDIALSFEVLEHVPEYERGFAEYLRVLRPGGVLLFSVPYVTGAPTITRARVRPDGVVEHILPPEYHGDPLNSAGCLCFRHFGLELLDQLRLLGYAEALALTYWEPRFGYVGNGEQLMFLARKPLS